MRRLETTLVNRLPEAFSWWMGILPVALWLSVLLSASAQAGGFRSPEECEGSIGEEHLKCLYSYIGIQRENAGKIEEVNTEKEMLDQLREQREQVDRQASGRHEEQWSLAYRTENSSAAAVPPSPSATTIPSFRSPEECRAYTGAAHLNCLYAYIEIQQSKAGKVEEELRTQKAMLGQLRDQVDRQASASHDLEQRLAERDSPSPTLAPAYGPPPIYPGYGYGYPGYGYPGFGYLSPGLGLYFGGSGFYYGRSFYGPRFFGPRFYGPRFYGPRFYGGSRSFGHHRR